MKHQYPLYRTGTEVKERALAAAYSRPRALNRPERGRGGRVSPAMSSQFGERCEYLRGRLLNVLQTLRKRVHVSVPELDVITRGRTGVEPDGMANDEGSRLGFGLADLTRCAFAAVVTVQEFVGK